MRKANAQLELKIIVKSLNFMWEYLKSSLSSLSVAPQININIIEYLRKTTLSLKSNTIIIK